MDREFYQLELEYAQKGQRIAGADEAGRGPLAGPVVAAACIMPADFFIEGIDDSKKLTPKKRDALYEQIMQNDCMKAYNAAKQEVDAAMRFVNQILAAAVNGEDPDTITEESCGGDCASCGGCH